MNGRWLTLAAVAPLVSMATPAVAGTATAQFAVTATIASGGTCTIAAAPLNFGQYDPTSTSPNDAQSQITVTCPTGTTYNLGVDSGLTGNRQMVSPDDVGEALNYQLYADSTRGIPLGALGGSTGATESGTGTGAPHNISIYGEIPAQQTVGSGSYSDTVTATISF